MSISIKYDTKEVQLKIKDMEQGLSDLTVPFQQTGDDLIKFYGKEVFESEGGAMDGRWRPLSAGTILARAMRRGHYANPPIATDKILTWTGDLRNGFKKQVSRLQLVISNSVEYFKYNQPDRPMLGINQKVIDIVMKNITSYINKIVKK